jgi:hypothetical protein
MLERFAHVLMRISSLASDAESRKVLFLASSTLANIPRSHVHNKASCKRTFAATTTFLMDATPNRVQNLS